MPASSGTPNDARTARRRQRLRFVCLRVCRCTHTSNPWLEVATFYSGLLRIHCAITPVHGVAPDNRVPPHHDVTPIHLVPPDYRVTRKDAVAPDYRVPPNDGVAPHH